jgi:hypothetical protein
MALFSRCFDVNTESKQLFKPFGTNLMEQGETRENIAWTLKLFLTIP